MFWIRIWIQSGFNQVSVSGSGSGSRRAKMTNKNRKRLRNFMFQVQDGLFWGLEASPVAFMSFKGGLGISKLQFKKTFQLFFPNFWSSTLNPDLDPYSDPDSLEIILDQDPFPDPDSMNLDRQHCKKAIKILYIISVLCSKPSFNYERFHKSKQYRSVW